MTAQDNVLSKRGGLLSLAAGLFSELQTNRRAAGGLLVIAILAGGYGLFPLGDASDALRGSYVQASLRQERIAGAGTEKDWPARAEASTALREALEKRLWPAESEGVARANVQDWVTAAGRDAGLDKLRVTIELTRPKGLAPDLRQVIATINASFTDTTLIRFLERAARESHLLVIDRLHVQQRPVAMIEMTLIAYARLVRASGAPPK
jgi:hypothetical protein